MTKESGSHGNRGSDEDDHSKKEGETTPSEEHVDSEEKQDDIIKSSKPTSDLEIAYHKELERKDIQILRLTREISKLKAFISKRKQTYKRKRKDEGAPTRALSAYNIFVQDRFSKLARDNEAALKSTDVDAQLKRVPPASLVASTGNEWKELSPEDRKFYEDKAASDKKRYQTQMANYQPPEKQKNKKRNKTGYNIFFSAHVLELKKSEIGVPSERGSVARIVGNAWKDLSQEKKQKYERDAQKQNAREVDSNDEEDSKESVPKKNKQRGHSNGDVDPLEDRMVHGAIPHHGSALMHQIMQGQAMHHGPPSHLNPSLGLAAHGYPPTQHHLGHQGQAFAAHHNQSGAYAPIPPGHRNQSSHYPPNSYPGPML